LKIIRRRDIRKVYRRFTFIDLFAGIGGFRIGCERNFMKCVFSSEIDKYACETYLRNFGEDPMNDIIKTPSHLIPSHDLLCGGFPCQTFSIAGKRKGFDDIRGTLFFEIARILRDKRPKVFLLENVEGLISHDGGRTLSIILGILSRSINGNNLLFLDKDSLKYDVYWTVLNSADFGLAQNRRRIFIVGFRNDLKIIEFSFPRGDNNKVIIGNILEEKVDEKYFITKSEMQRLVKRRSGFCGYLNNYNDKCSTLVSGSYGKGGYMANHILIRGKIKKKDRAYTLGYSSHKGGYMANYLSIDSKCNTVLPEFAKRSKLTFNQFSHQFKDKNQRIRIFTQRECARLQGFPDSFKIHKKDNQAYKQIGNAVSPPVIYEIVKNILKVLKESKN